VVASVPRKNLSALDALLSSDPASSRPTGGGPPVGGSGDGEDEDEEDDVEDDELLEGVSHVSLSALDALLSSDSASLRPTGGGPPVGGSGDVEDEDEEDDVEEDELSEGVTHGPLSTLPPSSRLASPERGVAGVPRPKPTGVAGPPP
jgi:hypothetical protein